MLLAAVSACSKQKEPGEPSSSPTPAPTATEATPTPSPTESPTATPTPEPTPTAEEAIRTLIETNMAAMEKEDLDAVMATIQKKSPLYEPTKKAVERAFESLDLTFELEQVSVVRIDDASAEIEITQITRSRKPGTGAFRDNRIVALHELEKVDGQWFFTDSDVKETVYLDIEKAPAAAEETAPESSPEPQESPETSTAPTPEESPEDADALEEAEPTPTAE